MKKLPTPENVSVFYKFISASLDESKRKNLAEIDPVDERILQQLAMSWKDDVPVTVMQTMHAIKFISTTTAHRRLKALRKMRMIDLRLCDHDNRLKMIVPTEKTLKYFEHMGRCITEASA